MKKITMILLVAVMAVSAAFAQSGVSAKIGYDVMSFGEKEAVMKYNGLSFGLKGNVGFYKNFEVTASVDGVVPFFCKEIDDKSWSNYANKAFGLKTKIGLADTWTVERFSFRAGVDGIYSALFRYNDASYMNFGIGADLVASYHLTDHVTLDVMIAPELMFGNSYISTQGWSNGGVNKAAPGCSGQLGVSYNF